MKKSERINLLRYYRPCGTAALITGAGYWLLANVWAFLRWLIWSAHEDPIAWVAPWDWFVLLLMFLVGLGCLVVWHWGALPQRINADQAGIVKHLTLHGIQRAETIYQGQYCLPLGHWVSSHVSLLPTHFATNEIVVWIEEHAARACAEVLLHVIDPVTFERSEVPLQAIFQRALSTTVWEFSCQEVVQATQRVNCAVLQALNLELAVYGLRADRYTLRQLRWVDSGARYTWDEHGNTTSVEGPYAR